jgi:hypothetical protein
MGGATKADFRHATRDLAHLDSDIAAVIKLAQKTGFQFTPSELKAHVISAAES